MRREIRGSEVGVSGRRSTEMLRSGRTSGFSFAMGATVAPDEVLGRRREMERARFPVAATNACGARQAACACS